MREGNVVRLKKYCLGNSEDDRGVVVNTHKRGSDMKAHVLFENGDSDSFNQKDFESFLEVIGRDKSYSYKFISFDQLDIDYKRKLFNKYFGKNKSW